MRHDRIGGSIGELIQECGEGLRTHQKSLSMAAMRKAQARRSPKSGTEVTDISSCNP
jgi:hypothetical protein